MGEEKVMICGVMHQYGKDDFSAWIGFTLTEEEEKIIEEILMRHSSEGYSIRGTWKECLNDII